MSRSCATRLLVVAFLGGLAACGDREPPPPATARPPAARVADSAIGAADTLRGDSIMARDTARIPE
jgi:hypothetical protein